jgi:hypothetical protein
VTLQDIEHPGELLATEGENSWEAKAEAGGAWSIFSGPKAAEEYRHGLDRREVKLVKHGRAFSRDAWLIGPWSGRSGWTDAGCRPRYAARDRWPIPKNGLGHGSGHGARQQA